MKAVLESGNHGSLYRVKAAITNRPIGKAQKGYELAHEHGITLHYIDPFSFPSSEAFYTEVAKAAESIGPDVIGLSGWLKKYSIVHPVLINPFEGRIWNVHPAKGSILYRDPQPMLAEARNLKNRHPLEIGTDQIRKRNCEAVPRGEAYRMIDDGWEMMYWGDDAVFAAELFGEASTCSIIHVVEEKLDTGPIVVSSADAPISHGMANKWIWRHAYDRMRDDADGTQGVMKGRCDGRAFCKALELGAAGRLRIEGRDVWVDGELTPYGGYKMKADE